jgi:hypothetical protein
MAKKKGVSGLSDRFLFALIDLEPEARPSGLDLSAVCFRLETLYRLAYSGWRLSGVRRNGGT